MFGHLLLQKLILQLLDLLHRESHLLLDCIVEVAKFGFVAALFFGLLLPIHLQFHVAIIRKY